MLDSYTWTILSALLSLIVVLFLAYLTVKWMGRRMSVSSGAGRIIKILDRVPLGQDKSLLVVEAGEKVLLVGVAGNSVQTLAELDSLPESDLPQTSSDFSQVLRETLAGGIKRFKKEGEDERH